MTANLTPNNEKAIAFVRGKAKAAESRDREWLAEALRGMPFSPETFARQMLGHSKVSICFHPYRICENGKTVIENLIADGVYRNQFVTRISNGGVTAYPGGDRDLWEKRMFGEAYHAPGACNEERPKYGALNLLNFFDGAAPRFGCCDFVLSNRVLGRCTFTFGDSMTLPDVYGTQGAFLSMARAVLEDAMNTGRLLDAIPCGPEEAIRLLYEGSSARPPQNGRDESRTIEAQVHGHIDLAADVDAVSVDEAFRGTAVEEQFLALSRKYNIPIRWIPRRSVPIEEIDENFRGPVMRDIAQKAVLEAGNSSATLDAAVIAHAARSAVEHPDRWAAFSTPPGLLQRVKQLWHIVANYGCPRA